MSKAGYRVTFRTTGGAAYTTTVHEGLNGEQFAAGVDVLAYYGRALRQTEQVIIATRDGGPEMLVVSAHVTGIEVVAEAKAATSDFFQAAARGAQ